jgi:hypothetical protein
MCWSQVRDFYGIIVKTIKITAGKFRGDIGAIRRALTLSFRIPRPLPTKKEPFSQNIFLKI